MLSRSQAQSPLPQRTSRTVVATYRRSHKYKPGHPSYKDHNQGEAVYFHPTESMPQPSEMVLKSQRSRAFKRTVFAQKTTHGSRSYLLNCYPCSDDYTQYSTDFASAAENVWPRNNYGRYQARKQDSDAKYYRVAFYLILFLATITQYVAPLALVLSLSMDLIISVLAGRWLDFKLLLGGAAAMAFMLLHACIAVVAYVLLRVLGLGAAIVACTVRKTAEVALWLESTFQRIAAYCGVDV